MNTQDITPDPADEAPGNPTITMSLDDFGEIDTPEDSAAHGVPEVLRIGKTPSLVSFFTTDGVAINAHYLPDADDWPTGYVRCAGDGCPACTAGITVNSFLMLPVADRVEGKVALLRVPTQKGPGKLWTEIKKVLDLPERDKIIAKIMREGRYNYIVEPVAAPDHDPQIIRAVQRFSEGAEAGEVDLADSMPIYPNDDLATHPQIAKRLQLGGLA